MTGDASRICQVLVNLLINAVKFTKDCEISIQVNGTQLFQLFNDVYEIHFSVRDTGIGISQETIEDYSSPFHRRMVQSPENTADLV
jgi:signal transduction histidine kinase